MIPAKIYTVKVSYPVAYDIKNFAKQVVRSRLVVCVQISQVIESIYSWQGELCEEQEVSVEFKVTDTNLSLLFNSIKKHHPYDIPQILVTKYEYVNEEYQLWAQS